MEWLVCKACGSSAIIPMDVEIENVDLTTGEFDVSDIDEDGILDLGEDLDPAADVDGDALNADADQHGVESDELTGNLPASEFDQESRFYSCHVCGDNWLAVRELEPEGACLVTFIHQMGMAPVLKRIAHMQTHVVINDGTVESWEYFLDDERIEEGPWLEKLKGRRRVLKSVASN
jgi:hypothetical protein